MENLANGLGILLGQFLGRGISYTSSTILAIFRFPHIHTFFKAFNHALALSLGIDADILATFLKNLSILFAIILVILTIFFILLMQMPETSKKSRGRPRKRE